MIHRGKRNTGFIVACCFLIFATGARGQTKSRPAGTEILPGLMNYGISVQSRWPPAPAELPKHLPGGTRVPPLSTAGMVAVSAMPIQAGYYCSQLGFFCKKEWQFEKSSHIPLRLRVGSLADCNFLEGKK